MVQVCDGAPDCSVSEDEENCLTTTTSTTPAPEIPGTDSSLSPVKSPRNLVFVPRI